MAAKRELEHYRDHETMFIDDLTIEYEMENNAIAVVNLTNGISLRIERSISGFKVLSIDCVGFHPDLAVNDLYESLEAILSKCFQNYAHLLLMAACSKLSNEDM